MEQFTAADNDYWRRFNEGLIKPVIVPKDQIVTILDNDKMSGIQIISFQLKDQVYYCSLIDFKCMFDKVIY